MAITGIDQDTISKIIRDNLTPSSEITTPERLFGRERALRDVTRALNSNGRSVFIHGDRGVGKSSVALTAATLITDSSMSPIRILCGKEDTFAKVIRSIGNSCIDVTQRIESSGKKAQYGLNVFGTGASYSPGERPHAVVPLPRKSQ